MTAARYSEAQKRRHERERQIVSLRMTWRDADALRRFVFYELATGNLTAKWRRHLERICDAAKEATGT